MGFILQIVSLNKSKHFYCAQGTGFPMQHTRTPTHQHPSHPPHLPEVHHEVWQLAGVLGAVQGAPHITHEGAVGVLGDVGGQHPGVGINGNEKLL